MTVQKTIAMEARGEPILGQIFVACVIRNRAKKRCLTHEQVCLQPLQFSCWNTDAPKQELSEIDLDCAAEAWSASQYFVDKLNFKANLYYNPHKCCPKWAKSDKVKKVCEIGNHIFMEE